MALHIHKHEDKTTYLGRFAFTLGIKKSFLRHANVKKKISVRDAWESSLNCKHFILSKFRCKKNIIQEKWVKSLLIHFTHFVFSYLSFPSDCRNSWRPNKWSFFYLQLSMLVRQGQGDIATINYIRERWYEPNGFSLRISYIVLREGCEKNYHD